MARMNFRLRLSGSAQTKRMSTVLASSSRSSTSHIARVKSSPSSGWANSHTTAFMPSSTNTSRKALGSASRRRRSSSTCCSTETSMLIG